MNFEPNGGNLYRPHLLAVSSGELWRCKHGRTGFRSGIYWIGCEECAKEDPVSYQNFHDTVDRWKAMPGPDNTVVLKDEPGKAPAPITKAQALEALDSMDDYARMNIGVDAKGPRETLQKFIEQQSQRPADRVEDPRAECVHVEVAQRGSDFTVQPATRETSIAPEDLELMKESLEVLCFARVLIGRVNAKIDAKIDPVIEKLGERIEKEIRPPKPGDPAGWLVSYDRGKTWEYRNKDPRNNIGMLNALVRPVVYGDEKK